MYAHTIYCLQQNVWWFTFSWLCWLNRSSIERIPRIFWLCDQYNVNWSVCLAIHSWVVRLTYGLFAAACVHANCSEILQVLHYFPVFWHCIPTAYLYGGAGRFRQANMFPVAWLWIDWKCIYTHLRHMFKRSVWYPDSALSANFKLIFWNYSVFPTSTTIDSRSNQRRQMMRQSQRCWCFTVLAGAKNNSLDRVLPLMLCSAFSPCASPWNLAVPNQVHFADSSRTNVFHMVLSPQCARISYAVRICWSPSELCMLLAIQRLHFLIGYYVYITCTIRSLFLASFSLYISASVFCWQCLVLYIMVNRVCLHAKGFLIRIWTTLGRHIA